MTDAHSIEELHAAWLTAETAGDVATLGMLATDDFVLVGPHGFVLDRQQWLDRYAVEGGLRTTSLSYDDVQVRTYGDTAVTVGVHTQEASYGGHPADGSFRTTHVLVGGAQGWRLAGMHLSPMPSQ